ncbi:MAG: nucleotidyltransferase family protein [Candidatus Hydrogenedentota bacterium]
MSEIGVFGAYVRGEATVDSDIDILVAFDRPVGFFEFLGLEENSASGLAQRLTWLRRPRSNRGQASAFWMRWSWYDT